MIAGQELQTLILELASRMSQIEQTHAKAHSPPLAPAEMTALRFIVKNAPVRMSDLARNVSLPQSSATNLADKLHARALVRRERPEANRRVVTLTPTAPARRLIAKIETEQIAVCDELVAELAPPQAELLRQILGQLSGNHATSKNGS